MCTRSVYDPQRPWQERLDELIDAIKALIDAIKALPSATELAFIQYSQGTGDWQNINKGPPRLPGYWRKTFGPQEPARQGVEERHFRYNPHLLGQFVPDARGALVLTDAHLSRAHDLSDWPITNLGHGRHLVLAKDLAAWFAQPDPDPEVLTKARADFGGMILTLGDIPHNPPPISEAQQT